MSHNAISVFVDPPTAIIPTITPVAISRAGKLKYAVFLSALIACINGLIMYRSVTI